MKNRSSNTWHSRNERLRRLATAIFAAIPLSLVVACEKSEAPPPTEVQVEAAIATTAPITEHITADAVLAPAAQAAIAPKITAPVKTFYVQRGSIVKAGQLLATLENRDLTAAMHDNQGSFEAAQAAYQSTVKAQVPEDAQRAEMDMAQAKANLDLNLEIVKSRKQLFAEGAIAGRDLDTAQAALVQAQGAYDGAEKHLAAMQQVSREAALKNASGQLESAEGKYQAAQAGLSYSEIRSPIAGVVTEKPLNVGETAAAGTPLITVMDTSALLAKVHLPQAQAQLLRVGAEATVLVPGLDQPVQNGITGKVTLVSPALDPGSTTVEVWIRIENSRSKLRPGTAVKVSLSGKSSSRALVIPSQSIVTTAAGKDAVMVVDGSSVAHQTNVETGIADGGNTQILSGLSPGQRVVTAGAYALDDGTHVKVVSSLEGGGDTDKPDNQGGGR
jgi:HlyD family secretion protein